MGIIGNIIKFFFRAFFRIIFSSLLAAIIGAGLALLISFLVTNIWPPTTLTIAAAIVIAVLAAYAVGMTVLVGEAIAAVRDAEKGVAKEVGELEGKK
jgi:hypothetical protein